MKIRSSFVSNSSSSSFIIVDGKGKPPCECCGRGYPNIFEAIEERNAIHNDDGIDALGKEEIMQYLIGNSYSDDGCTKAEKLLESIQLQSGEEIGLVSISYHDEVLNEMLKGCRICVGEDEFYE